MGDKLNQTNNSDDNNLGHFFKATDFDDIAMKVIIMKIILNISPCFVLAFLIVVMKRFVSVTACLIHNNYESESMVGECCQHLPFIEPTEIYANPIQGRW